LLFVKKEAMKMSRYESFTILIVYFKPSDSLKELINVTVVTMFSANPRH